MERRRYRLGRRQQDVDRTAAEILAAGRRLVAASPASELSVSAVASEAGVSRITVYNRFGSRGGLIAALAPPPPNLAAVTSGDARAQLRARLMSSCLHWSADPAVHRNLNRSTTADEADVDRGLAERLGAADSLRPGCSIREAEDVIGALTSFPVFDRLHKDGRRPPAAVAEILWRLASGILAQDSG